MMQDNKKICQSCGLPLQGDNFGSNSDTTFNNEYCKFCFKNGDFILADLTLNQQIERLSEMAYKKFGTPKDEAIKMAQTLLPTLKRWK